MGCEKELQELYVKLLSSDRIIFLLDSPAKIFEELCAQKVETALKSKEKLRQEIRSCRMLKQQATTLLNVLKKTSYKELRRVQSAVRSGIRKQLDNNDEIRCQLDAKAGLAFEGIALDLKLAAGKAIEFLPALTTKYSQRAKRCQTELTEREYDPGSCPMAAPLQRQLFFTLMDLEQKENLEAFLASPGIKKKQVWKDPVSGHTVLHSAAISSRAVEFITTIIKFVDKNEDFPWTPQEFINAQTGDGYTALHLAIYWGSIQAVKCLLDLGAGTLIRDNDGKTPMDLMYDLMPEALSYMLSNSGVSSYGALKDGGVNIRLDFGAFIDRIGQGDDAVALADDKSVEDKRNSKDLKRPNKSADRSRVVIDMSGLKNAAGDDDTDEEEDVFDLSPETDNLAFTIYRNPKTTAPRLLDHIVVKIFLELKWDKLKWPIYLLTLFYIAVYTSYTAIAAYVFIVECPYSAQDGSETNDSTGVSMTKPCELGIHPLVAVLFAIAMVFHIALEIWQYFLILSVSARSKREAFEFYLFDLENILQLLFMLSAFTVLGAVCAGVGPMDSDWTYGVVSFSIVISWTLILLQLGNFYGRGKYVHMLRTVFKSLSTVMPLYFCFLVGFSIAFCIIFPQANLLSYLKSFFRSFAMMTGDLNFDEVFKDEGKPWAFELASLVLFLGFIIIVTIVAGNLLIGLTVGDVAKIFKEADVIHRRIQVERLYIVEHLLLHVPRSFWSDKDIFVVPRGRRLDGAIVHTEMKKFSRELRQELRCLLASPEEYERQYLQFD